MPESSCSVCGAEFRHPPSVRRSYCSQACFRTVQRTGAPLTTRSCGQCAKEFTVRVRDVERRSALGAFCSARCRDSSRRNPDQECKACGLTFHPRRRPNGELSPYCSRTCAGSDRQDRVDCICDRCATSFAVKASEAARGDRKYCSVACAYPPVPPRPCENCGTGFTPTSSELERG